MWRDQSLLVGDDLWTAHALGYSAATHALEINLSVAGGEPQKVGPTVGWAYDSAVLSTSERTHEERVREGVTARWRIDGPKVVVMVDYEDLGRAHIRATADDLGEWSSLQPNVRRLTDNAEE